MGRPLRSQGGENWHFITAKSNPGLDLFRDAEDYSRFVSQLSQWHERHQVELAAYVLLPDHYHLLALFPAHNASRAMQWLNVSYGHWHQHRHAVKGHLFSRRFEVLTVQNDPACLACASLYLHLHPVRTMMGLSGRTGAWLPPMLNGSVAKARKHLVEFRWSSLNAWLHPDPRRTWLRPPPLTDYASLIKTTLDRGLPQSPEQAFSRDGECRKKAVGLQAVSPQALGTQTLRSTRSDDRAALRPPPSASSPASRSPSPESSSSPTSDLRPCEAPGRMTGLTSDLSPDASSPLTPDSSPVSRSPSPDSSSPLTSDLRPLTSVPPFRPSPSAQFRQEFLSRTLAKVLADLRSLSSPPSDSSSSPTSDSSQTSSPLTSDLRPPTSGNSPRRMADRDRLLAIASRHGLTASDLSTLTGMTPSAILRSISRVHARATRKES